MKETYIDYDAVTEEQARYGFRRAMDDAAHKRALSETLFLRLANAALPDKAATLTEFGAALLFLDTALAADLLKAGIPTREVVDRSVN